MRYKATFLVGLVLGYVLGTRAGRERYEQMARAARAFMENPGVRRAGSEIQHRGGQMMSTATHKMGEKVGERVTPHLPSWVPGHRDTATGTSDAWAQAAEAHHNGHGV
jgi:hypothetical protein